MLRQLLEQEIANRKLSHRAAAREIGVAHTTVMRILNNEQADLDTVEKIGNWLGVGTSSLLGLNSSIPANPYPHLQVFLEMNPKLAKTLNKSIEDLLSTNNNLAIIEDVLSYLAFRLLRTK